MRPQNSSLPRVCLAIVPVGGSEETRRRRYGGNHEDGEDNAVLVHAQRALHSLCSAHYSNGTLIDERNGQERNVGHAHHPRPLPLVEKLNRSNGERSGLGRR